MQLYDITVAVNKTRQLDAPGSYFYYYSGSAGGADSTITLRGISSGLRIILKPGQSFRLPAGQRETSWMITNYAGAAPILGAVLVGDGEIQDNRITGSVEVVDGGKNRTMANATFLAYGNAGIVAGTYAHNQLWNPANSGKNAIVKRLIVGSSSLNNIQLRRHNAALANIIAPVQSKLWNGSVGVCQARQESNAALLGTFANINFQVPANQSAQLTFEEPIVITPGTGLVTVGAAAVATDCTTTFEFYEESI